MAVRVEIALLGSGYTKALRALGSIWPEGSSGLGSDLSY